MKYVERPLVIIVVAMAILQVFGIIVDSNVLANHILRLALVVLMVIYVSFSQFWLHKIREDLKFHDTIWQSIPYGIACYNRQGERGFCNDAYIRLQAGCPGQLYNAALERAVDEGGFHTLAWSVTNQTGTVHIESHCMAVLRNRFIAAITMLREKTEEQEAFAKQEEEYLEVVKVMVNMFELKDPFGQGHSVTVSNLVHDLAQSLNMTKKEIAVITKAALIHDIGKATIPADVLNQEELTDSNYEIIRKHAVIGAQIAENIQGLQEAALLVRHHHERYDGRGYPDGLSGEAIPFGSRMIAVIDAFDAMTTGRSVLGRRDVESAIAILQLEKGRQFDPQIVNDFTAMIQASRKK